MHLSVSFFYLFFLLFIYIFFFDLYFSFRLYFSFSFILFLSFISPPVYPFLRFIFFLSCLVSLYLFPLIFCFFLLFILPLSFSLYSVLFHSVRFYHVRFFSLPFFFYSPLPPGRGMRMPVCLSACPSAGRVTRWLYFFFHGQWETKVVWNLVKNVNGIKFWCVESCVIRTARMTQEKGQ